MWGVAEAQLLPALLLSLNSLLALTGPPAPPPAPLRCAARPAGILQEQVPAVLEAYAPWFEGFEVAAEDRWALVTAVRRQ